MTRHVKAAPKVGGYRKLAIGMLFDLAPGEAVKRLLALFRKYGGSPAAAAAGESVDVATLKRWCAKARAHDPQFRDRLEAIRQAAGEKIG